MEVMPKATKNSHAIVAKSSVRGTTSEKNDGIGKTGTGAMKGLRTARGTTSSAIDVRDAYSRNHT